MTRLQSLAGATLFLLALQFIPASLYAGPLAEQFSIFDADSGIVIDHTLWAMLLDRYLDSDHPSGINRFDYKAVDGNNRQKLNEYLEALQNQNPGLLNRNEQMAYWINLYNALTVQLILEAYPVESIRDITLPGSRRGPWKARLIEVSGTELSLDDIEHRILRPLWSDKRIHYAVNCASLGCPNLAAVPYTGAMLESMLNLAASDYINHPRAVSASGKRLVLSSIYDWYSEDFGSRDDLKNHLLLYADSSTAGMIQSSERGIRYSYDWSINAAD